LLTRGSDQSRDREGAVLETTKANDILEKVKRAWHVLKAGGYDKATSALDSIERCLSANYESPLACLANALPIAPGDSAERYLDGKTWMVIPGW
jgi:hypothetical protein